MAARCVSGSRAPVARSASSPLVLVHVLSGGGAARARFPGALSRAISPVWIGRNPLLVVGSPGRIPAAACCTPKPGFETRRANERPGRNPRPIVGSAEKPRGQRTARDMRRCGARPPGSKTRQISPASPADFSAVRGSGDPHESDPPCSRQAVAHISAESLTSRPDSPAVSHCDVRPTDRTDSP